MTVLADLLTQRFGIKTRSVVNPVTAAVAAAGNLILRNNPDRVGFIIINLSANIVYISPLPGVLATAGIRLAAGGDWRSFVWDEDFELCSLDWYATASAFPSAIYILESIGVK